VGIDAAGILYIADINANRIRRIDAAGIISTLAGTGESGYEGDGGPATKAKLYYPNSLAVSPAGDVYFTDNKNHVVRKVSADGIISTVAGTGQKGYSEAPKATACYLENPSGVALDAEGGFYFSDTGNHLVRKVASNGRIATVAGYWATGDSLGGYSGDGGPATGPS
jgi:sugar lactone lactonase YvrE